MPGGRDRGAYARVPNLLFRFFDFSATQGRRYQYRVRLVLNDPNHQIAPRYLAREVVDRRSAMKPSQRFRRFADWSEPSAPIAVPFAGRLVVGRATAALPRKLSGEPKVTALVKTFDQGKAAAAATELVEYVRGTVGNITASIEIFKLVDRELELIENYRFTTESSILDIRGGKKLSKNNNEDLTAPGHILVLTRTGKLVVQSELKEEMEYDEYRELFEEEESRDPMTDRTKRNLDGKGARDDIFKRR